MTAAAQPARRSRRSPQQAEAVAHARAYQAHQLRLAGLDWAVIAERVGYLDGKVACTAVNAWLQKTALQQSSDARRRALELELARLDQVQAAYYPAALAGDLGAANFVLKVVTRRCAVLGFDRVDDATDAPRSIVIAGSNEEYIAGLKAVVEGTHPGLVSR